MATVINGTTGIDKVQDGSVTSSKIVDGTITSGDMADGAVTLSKMAAGVIPAGVAKVSSNPLITTNGSLGDQWINTTTGELFILKDATTDANLWDGQRGSVVAPIADVNFKTVLYTGTGGTGTQAITGTGFETDFVWIKNRSAHNNGDHFLWDSLGGVGVNKNLRPSQNSGEGMPNLAYDSLHSFDTDGFTVGGSTYTSAYVNSSGTSYVAWCASLPNDSTDTSGSITSTIKTNGWMSNIKYTYGSGVQTIGHGLATAPEMILMKNRSEANNWDVYHKDIGPTKRLKLNENAATQTYNGMWNDTAPDDNVFSTNNWYTPGNTVSVYAFRSVVGNCKVGSYTGTGASGNIIDVGFEPGWILFKRTDSLSDWVIHDSVRGGDYRLYPNEVDPEGSGYAVTFNATSFEVPASAGNWNAAGSPYIYLAIAKQL